MTIQYLTTEDMERLKHRLPPGLWDKIRSWDQMGGARKVGDTTDLEKEYRYLYDKYGLTKDEIRAISFYKSPSGDGIQQSLRKKQTQKMIDTNQKLNHDTKHIPHIDSLISKNKVPDELNGYPLYRGTRIDYGTAIIKSGKKPGDMIRDPRYQSFSLNPGTAMFHTSRSQFGDLDGFGHFPHRKKVLLEHMAKGGETGIYGGNNDKELEVIYPRNKSWKITGVRDEDVIFGSYPEEHQNARIYTIERKKQRVVRKKQMRRKKTIKKCRCKK